MKVRELFEEQSDRSGELIKTIRTHCWKNFNAYLKNPESMLFRVHDTSTEQRASQSVSYQVVTSLKSPRRSLLSSQMPIIFVSEHEAWKDFPNRSYSTFAITELSLGSAWGEPSIVIPFDNVKKYGVVPEDFNFYEINNTQLVEWADIINEIPDALEDFAEALRESGKSNELYYAIDVAAEHAFDLRTTSSLVDIKNLSSAYDEVLKLSKQLIATSKKSKSYEIQAAKRFISTYFGNIYEFFEKHLTPQKMGASLVTSLTDTDVSGSGDEVWFEGNYLLIRNPNDPSFSLGQAEFLKHDLLPLISKD